LPIEVVAKKRDRADVFETHPEDPEIRTVAGGIRKRQQVADTDKRHEHRIEIDVNGRLRWRQGKCRLQLRTEQEQRDAD
jgi:hypothetical protein